MKAPTSTKFSSVNGVMKPHPVRTKSSKVTSLLKNYRWFAKLYGFRIRVVKKIKNLIFK